MESAPGRWESRPSWLAACMLWTCCASSTVYFPSIRKGSCISRAQTLSPGSIAGRTRIHQVWLGPREPPWSWIDTWRCDYMAHYLREEAVEHFLWTEDEIDQLQPPLENLMECDSTTRAIRAVALPAAESHITLLRRYRDQEHFVGASDIARLEIIYRFGACCVCPRAPLLV